jgi:hypothetical protein
MKVTLNLILNFIISKNIETASLNTADEGYVGGGNEL